MGYSFNVAARPAGYLPTSLSPHRRRFAEKAASHKFVTFMLDSGLGAGIAQWLEHRTRD